MNETITPAANRRLAQWRVTWLIEHSTSHQLLRCIDSFVLRNPPHRKAQNRYLQSDAWQRKRARVLKRDGFRCVHCGMPASQGHHKRYRKNIGHEPVHWLESVCEPCHEA